MLSRKASNALLIDLFEHLHKPMSKIKVGILLLHMCRIFLKQKIAHRLDFLEVKNIYKICQICLIKSVSCCKINIFIYKQQDME